MPDLEINSSDGKGKVSTLDITSWIQTDRLVKAQITRTLSEEVLGLAVRLKSSAEVWEALAAAFVQNFQAREFELL